MLSVDHASSYSRRRGPACIWAVAVAMLTVSPGLLLGCDSTASPPTRTPVQTVTLTPSPTPTIASPSLPTTSLPPSTAASPSAPAAPDLVAAAWTFAENRPPENEGQPGRHALYFGRLDGRAFSLSAPSQVSTATPARNGQAIAWWWDRQRAETFVGLVDTAVGSLSDLLRTPAHIFSAAITPSGDELYWIPSQGIGHDDGEPQGHTDGLWRQALPDGEASKIADWEGGQATLDTSVDGASVLVVLAAPATSDQGPYDYRVWSRESSQLLDAGPSEYSPVGMFGDSIVVDSSFAAPMGLFMIDPNDRATKPLPTGSNIMTPGVYYATDDSSRLAYGGIDRAGLYAIFELSSAAAQPRQILPTSFAWPPRDEAPLLVRPSEAGGISIAGWAPVFPFGQSYLTGPKATVAGGADRLLVNLDDGTVAEAPPLSTPLPLQP